MRDGIFRLHYETPLLSATAALVVSGDALSGADRNQFMFGRCTRHGNRLEGTLTFKRHTTWPGVEQPVPEEFEMVLDGICGDDFGQIDLYCPAIPQLRGTGTFTWLGSQEPLAKKG